MNTQVFRTPLSCLWQSAGLLFLTVATGRVWAELETSTVASAVASTTASTTGQAVVKTAAAMPDQGAYLVKVLLGLMFVLGLVFAAAWLLKRVGQGTLVGSQHMKVLATLPLGTRERIALVDVGGQQLLLGITATSINTLHTFSEAVVTAQDKPGSSEFASKIREVMSKGVVKPK